MEKTASHQLHQALMAKGYRREATRYVEPDGRISRRLDYYQQGKNSAILETLSHEASREEIECHLYVAATNRDPLADAIPAIP